MRRKSPKTMRMRTKSVARKQQRQLMEKKKPMPMRTRPMAKTGKPAKQDAMAKQTELMTRQRKQVGKKITTRSLLLKNSLRQGLRI